MHHTQSAITPSSGKILDPSLVLKSCGIHSGMCIAEFGCGGNGHFVFAAAKLVGNNGSVFAIDVQQELLHSLESNARSHSILNIQTVCANLEDFGATKIPNNLLDGVLIINNQIGSTVQRAFLREAMRVLKQGGFVYLIDWLDGNTNPFASAISDRVAHTTSIANAQMLGFRLIDEFRPSRYHYGLRLQKS